MIALWSAENFSRKAAATTAVARCDRFLPLSRAGHSGEKVFLVGLGGFTSAGDQKEELLSASKQGKIRYIESNGHKSPDIHLKMLQTAFAHQFTFDAVQRHEPANQRGHHRVRIACNSSAGARGCRKLQSYGQG
jgi:hypothetical protein